MQNIFVLSEDHIVVVQAVNMLCKLADIFSDFSLSRWVFFCKCSHTDLLAQPWIFDISIQSELINQSPFFLWEKPISIQPLRHTASQQSRCMMYLVFVFYVPSLKFAKNIWFRIIFSKHADMQTFYCLLTEILPERWI